MNDGMRKTVVYNPAAYLEDILLRICDARDAQIQDFDTSFMDGTPITKLNVSLAELGVTEIKFIEQGTFLLYPLYLANSRLLGSYDPSCLVFLLDFSSTPHSRKVLRLTP